LTWSARTDLPLTAQHSAHGRWSRSVAHMPFVAGEPIIHVADTASTRVATEKFRRPGS
jgi:hypothetical protein